MNMFAIGTNFIKGNKQKTKGEIMNPIIKEIKSNKVENMDASISPISFLNDIRLMIIEQSKKMDEQYALLEIFIPKKVSLSYLVENTGKSRQALREYVINNFDYKTDFWKEGNKIFVSRNVATAILKRGA